MDETIHEARAALGLTDEQLAAMVEAAGGDAWQEGATADMAGDHVFKLDPDALRKLLSGAAVAQRVGAATKQPPFDAAGGAPKGPTPGEARAALNWLYNHQRSDAFTEFTTVLNFIDAVEASTPDQSADDTPIEQVQRIVHLRADRRRRVYVAGPMTGLPASNFPAFNARSAELRAAGWHVENPAEHGHIDGAVWADYLRWDISRIATCGSIHLLPGWSKSKGATLEVFIAWVLGMEIQLGVGAESVDQHVMGDLMKVAGGMEASAVLPGGLSPNNLFEAAKLAFAPLSIRQAFRQHAQRTDAVRASGEEQVPAGFKLVMVPDDVAPDEPDWDECKRQAEVATGLKVEPHSFSILKREIRRWLAHRTRRLVAHSVQLDDLESAAVNAMGTELGELACTGSYAPCEDAMGRLADALAVRRAALSSLPAGQRDRMVFYELQMKDPEAHAALAFELVYLRQKHDEGQNAARAGAKDGV